MNKNIKRIIAITFIISAFSANMPATGMNLLSTKVYAANNEIKSLELSDNNGSKLKLYDSDKYDNRVHDDELDDGEVYYAKSSTRNVYINVSGLSQKYVRVFKGTTDSIQGKKLSEGVKLLSDGSNTIIAVKVYNDEPGDNITYGDNNYDVQSTYKIKVKYTGDGSDSDNNNTDPTKDVNADTYDDIYLNKLSVDGNAIELSNSKVKYSYNVGSDIDKVTIQALPEDKKSDSVEIDNSSVESYDNYKKTVSLSNGENEIPIKLTNDNDDERDYTLIVNRGNTVSPNTSNTPSNSVINQNVDKKTNEWMQVNGKWQYNDENGNLIKNGWIGNYYVKDDGNMATEWLKINDVWYYFGSDGAMKVGWQNIDGIWYYFEPLGKMFTGWLKDKDGKYYYLNSDGSMAYNTKIGIYKLGKDGVWLG